MRILLWYVNRFSYRPALKNLPDVPDVLSGAEFSDAIIAFVHGEAVDEEQPAKVETKLIKNIKWLAGKLNCNNVVLHSFAHLAETKCQPDCLQKLFAGAGARLREVGLNVAETPFGYFLDIEMNAPGHALARVYKEF